MLVVSDTTPIISLRKMNQLALLHHLFGVVHIPFTVFKELTDNPKYQEEIIVLQASDYIQIDNVDDIEKVQSIRQTGLDAGESEAIVLAKQLSADVLLMDEAKGRMVAAEHGLQIMGTIGILLQSFKNGFLSHQDIIGCIYSLRCHHRRISEKLFLDLMMEIDRIDPHS